MAEFARAQLMKYGWTEGKGLGKNETGITEALRPKLKFDTAGVGHKDHDCNEWWASAYNKAANSITVDSKSSGVSISVSKKDTGNALPKEGSKKRKSGKTYGNFLKTSTLYGDSLVDENDSDKLIVENIERDVVQTPLTDEELFKACGGRTAHKGARHGLSLNGKLARIAQQEKKMLGLYTFRDTLSRSEKQDTESQDEYEMDSNANTILPLSLSPTPESSAPELSKDARRTQKRRINDLTHQLNTLCNMNDSNNEPEHNASKGATTKKQLKRKRSKDRKQNLKCNIAEGVANQEICDIMLPASSESEKVRIKKGKTHKEKTHSKKMLDRSVDGECQEYNEKELEHMSKHNSRKKKSKRKRSRSRQDRIATDMQVDQEISYVPKSKQSKKSNNKIDIDFKFLVRDGDVSTSKYKFDADPSFKATPAEIRNAERYLDSSSSFSKKTADYLNYRIKKKKISKLYKKRINLEKITDGLKAAHSDAESSKAMNAQQKLETIVENLMAVNITENKTESLKKSAKKDKKKQTVQLTK